MKYLNLNTCTVNTQKTDKNSRVHSFFSQTRVYKRSMRLELQHPLKDPGLRAVRIVTVKDEYYTNKRLFLHEETGYVNLSSVIKAINKTDKGGEVTRQFWYHLKPEPENSDRIVFKKQLYVSGRALVNLVKQKRLKCKKTWGAFYKDGMGGVFQEITGEAYEFSEEEEEVEGGDVAGEEEVEGGGVEVSGGDGAGPSRKEKGKGEANLESLLFLTDGEGYDPRKGFAALSKVLTTQREQYCATREGVLADLEEGLAAREAVLKDRESLVLSRERRVLQVEIVVKRELEKQMRCEKELRKRGNPNSDKGKHALFKDIFKVVSEYQTKREGVSRSRSRLRSRSRTRSRSRSPPARTVTAAARRSPRRSSSPTPPPNMETANTLVAFRDSSPIPDGSPARSTEESDISL